MAADRASDRARYGGALLASAVVLAIRLALGPLLAPVPYFPAYFALLIASRYWGLGPSLLVVALCGIGSTLLPPPASAVRLLIFLATAGVLIWIVEIFRRARGDAERNERLAEERLAQFEAESALSAQLRAIVESSEDAILSSDMDGVIRSWNRGAEQVFGYAAAEAIGQRIGILLDPEHENEAADLTERARQGGNLKHVETVRRRKGGAQIDVSLTVSPLRGPDGAIVGYSWIARDITERKALEEQLQQTQKLESLGVLAGGIAHDFNNLLTGIMGNASLAMSELGHPEQARERLAEVLQASDRAAILIRQMLAYAGKGRVMLENLDLSAEVEEIVRLLRSSLSKSVDFQLRLDRDLPHIEGDCSQIQQLIMNLALNAAEALDDRPGVVTISTSLRTTASGKQVVLEVADTGVGMTEEVKARMFDPFFSTKFAGRGLGLSAVTGIIRTHKGRISVESQPGHGATITVVLPAAAAEAPPAEHPAEVELLGHGRILVADDEDLVRKMAKFTLETYGYATEIASNGAEALEKFRSGPAGFDAVLLDLTMPVMSGEDVLHAIRKIRSDVPVVLSSGYTETEAFEKFHGLGLSGFLQKPYTATALARKIKQAVDFPPVT
jgi:PAS domain S-box-containing protein